MTAMFQFGTRLNPQMVPMFSAGPDISQSGYSSETGYLNGGVSVRNSVGGHMTYNMVWNPTRLRDELLRPIIDYANGVYDTTDGVNLIYFIDPVAADKNVAPMAWGFPAQAARDAMPIISNANGPIRPAQVNTTANSLLYPARSAVYTIAGTETAKKLYIPIPPGYCAWIGSVGSKTGSTGMQVTPFTGAAAGTVIPLAMTTPTNPVWATTSISSASGYTGLELQVIIAAGTLTLTANMIQILPVGATPLAGKFISGQGHSGCEFSGKPTQSPYQVAGRNAESVGMSVRLVERGDWV